MGQHCVGLWNRFVLKSTCVQKLSSPSIVIVHSFAVVHYLWLQQWTSPGLLVYMYIEIFKFMWLKQYIGSRLVMGIRCIWIYKYMCILKSFLVKSLSLSLELTDTINGFHKFVMSIFFFVVFCLKVRRQRIPLLEILRVTKNANVPIPRYKS